MVVLVTGANGQLGQSLQHISAKYPQAKLVYYNSSDLNITDFSQCQNVFNEIKPDFCINAAAYTAVDKAESDTEKAYAVNVNGAENLAKACLETGCTLIHISTDFVFDGTLKKPYTEEDATNPQGVYGMTKRQGEQAIEAILKQHLIIRTSWLYSQFANNFMKTMLRLGTERDTLSVVNDQTGTPTNAVDLAEVLLQIIIKLDANEIAERYGIYHFSNEGVASWYDFAKQIFEINQMEIELHPIPTTQFPTPAKRPEYSVLDKSKIRQTFGIDIADWKQSLKISD